ncbi:MAG: hypothetical protein ABJE95_30200 [Byssovorax sp.]
MADTKTFDGSKYLQVPRLDLLQAFSLAIALLSAVPRDAGAGSRRAAKALRAATVILQKLWSARQRSLSTVKTVDKAAADNRIDVAWGALKMRISGCAMLPQAASPRVAIAEVLEKKLFPAGMAFLKAPMEAEWAVSDELITRIDNDKLAAEIDDVAGPEYLVEIRAAHIAYGEALGITKAHVVANDVAALLEPMRAVISAIGDYALQIVATVDRSDPATITAAKNALLPLDRYRENAARRSAKGSKAVVADPTPEATPETPIPEVPDLPTK